MLLKLLSITENDIIKLKNEKDYKKAQDKAINLFKCLRIKFTLFFIISFILLFLFWYYLTSFCAVYKNTQSHLIKDSFISFGLSMFYPFAINLIAPIFRISSLKCEGNHSCMYKISQWIAII